MATSQYKSHAKINLGLKVVNKREDGYHNIQSIFVELDLHDKLEFTPTEKFKLTNFFTVSGVIEILFSVVRSSLTDPIIFIISV